MKMVRFRTPAGLYVFEIRGLVFLTWVESKEKARAAQFPQDKREAWRELLQDMADQPLICEGAANE